ncbi:AMP-binding protein [Sphaerisporangium sp. NPDC051017]|uniref:AMP-binding protein n=1 Tax=Sphaerisporangium sp. NPDC051017 TaxID=3154636 RepID=UPI0034342A3F
MTSTQQSEQSTSQAENAVLPIGDQLGRLAAEKPDAPAVTCGAVTITRGELESSTNRLARAYAELGVGQGDYVTIVLPNGLEWIQAAVAAWKLGAIVAPLSARLPENEYRDILALVPRALIVGREGTDMSTPSVPSGFEPSSSLSDEPLPSVVSPVWKVVPSGGSTGRPKLIAATQDSRIDAGPLAAAMGLIPGETQIVTGPLTHNTPFVTTIQGLLLGQHVVLMARFDAEECLRLIAEHRVTFMSTVPTVLQRMLPVYKADPSAYDVSSIHHLWHMAAACPPELKEAWMDILGPTAVWEMYGGSEMVSVTAIRGDQWLAHRGSVGRPLVGEMKIVDEEGRMLPAGEVGEIFMRPTAGATYRYIGSEPETRDGWDTVGDLGWFDEDGFLYISDRRVDMFNVGGRKVYPAEVESAISAHPAILSCLVVGIPDDDLGQVPYALVEADPSAELTADELVAFLAERIAGYKVPRQIEFRDAPLRDLAGKARRTAVRDEVISRLVGSTQS